MAPTETSNYTRPDYPLGIQPSSVHHPNRKNKSSDYLPKFLDSWLESPGPPITVEDGKSYEVKFEEKVRVGVKIEMKEVKEKK